MTSPLSQPVAYANPPWWHVAWPTFLADSPVVGAAGEALADMYRGLAQAGEQVAIPVPIAVAAARSPRDRLVLLSSAARDVVRSSIVELAAQDRVAGGTPLAAVGATSTAVHVVLCCPLETLHQRVGRLKSRTATLLAFSPELGVGGRNTWARGFWSVQLPSATAVQVVARFVAAFG